MFVSAPGVGKSVIAMVIAIGIKLPTLYISADTSTHTVGVRAAAHLTGESVAAVDKMMRVEPTFYNETIQAGVGHVLWECKEHNSSPDITDIKNQIDAFAALHGDYPHLIVVDNLRNMYSEEEDTSAMQHNCEKLMQIAAETGSAVLVLHHTTGAFEDGTLTPTLGALEQKVGKLPSLVVTFSYGKLGDLRAAVCKNRYGPASAAGHLTTFIPVDMSHMRIG